MLYNFLYESLTKLALLDRLSSAHLDFAPDSQEMQKEPHSRSSDRRYPADDQFLTDAPWVYRRRNRFQFFVGDPPVHADQTLPLRAD